MKVKEIKGQMCEKTKCFVAVMVREDDSDIKGASDTVPALRNREDQRGTQSRRKAGVYPGRSRGMALPWWILRVQAGLTISESWFVSTSRINSLFRYRCTGTKLSETVKTERQFMNLKITSEKWTHIIWLMYFFSRQDGWETQLLWEVSVVHLQWEAKLPDQDTYNFWPAHSFPRATEPGSWIIIRR